MNLFSPPENFSRSRRRLACVLRSERYLPFGQHTSRESARAVCGSIATPFKAWINAIKEKDLVKKVWLKPVSNLPFYSST